MKLQTPKQLIALTAAVIASLMLIAAGCTTSNQAQPADIPNAVAVSLKETLPVDLAAHPECDSLLADLKQKSASQVNAWGLPDLGTAGAEQASVARRDHSSGLQLSGFGEGSFTEADFTVTDGKILAGIDVDTNTLWLVDISADKPKLAGTVALPSGSYREILLFENKAWVFGDIARGDSPQPKLPVYNSDGNGTIDTAADSPPAEPSDTSPPERIPDEQIAAIAEISLADIYRPAVVRYMEIEGYYLGAQLTNGKLTVAVRSRPANKLGFVAPAYDSPSAENKALKTNRQIVADSKITDWMPQYVLTDMQGTELAAGLVASCSQTYQPDTYSGFNQISVVSIDPTKPLAVADAVTLIAEGSIVRPADSMLYISHVVDNFSYVAAAVKPKQLKTETAIHQFSFDSSGQLDYVASGAVPGYPVGRQAFHKIGDHLLLTATVDAATGQDKNQSFIYTLQRKDNRLVAVAATELSGFSKGIGSVAYQGDRGYLTGFHDNALVYMLDLSQPDSPKIAGTVAVPGQTGSLHPLGDSMLLDIGEGISDQHVSVGSQLSLIDVSDPSNPILADTLTFPAGHAGVEGDQHSVIWLADEQTIIVPLTNHATGFFGVAAVKISDNQQMSVAAKLSHHAKPVLAGDKQGCEWYKLPPVAYAGAIVKICPVGAEPEPDRYGRSSLGVPDNHVCYLREGDSLTSDRPEWPFVPVGEHERMLRPTEDLLEVYDAMTPADYDRISLCYRDDSNLDSKQINRVLETQAGVWTVSPSQLQLHSLNGFGVQASINLPG